jgi:hypothetical protein
VHEPVRDVLPDAIAALDRPDPVRVTASSVEHLDVAGLVGPETTAVDDAAPFVDHLDGGRTLVWIHPDNHAHGVHLPASADQ